MDFTNSRHRKFKKTTKRIGPLRVDLHMHHLKSIPREVLKGNPSVPCFLNLERMQEALFSLERQSDAMGSVGGAVLSVG